jgi:hypothetical protein
MEHMEGRYGIVKIVGGKYRGRCGFYDDDTPEGGLVYLEVPWVSGYVFVKLYDLAEPTPSEAEAWSNQYETDEAYAKARAALGPVTEAEKRGAINRLDERPPT